MFEIKNYLENNNNNSFDDDIEIVNKIILYGSAGKTTIYVCM